jgi:septal ring factor EnvC (AmiA/AmiB activator)
MTSKKVYTNISANPVVLSDGSSVQPGEQTTDDQYELAKGSLWAEHGLLVPGEPDVAPETNAQLDELRTENAQLKQDLFDETAKRTKLETDLKDLPDQLKAAQDKLTEEQARSTKLETDLKAALAKK